SESLTAAFHGSGSAVRADFAPADAWSSSRAGAQELAAGSLARASRRASCDVPVVAPPSGISSGGCCGTRGTASTGKGALVQAECPQEVPFRTQTSAWRGGQPALGVA